MNKLIAAIVAATFAMGTAFAQAPVAAAHGPAAQHAAPHAKHKKVVKKHKKHKKHKKVVKHRPM